MFIFKVCVEHGGPIKTYLVLIRQDVGMNSFVLLFGLIDTCVYKDKICLCLYSICTYVGDYGKQLQNLFAVSNSNYFI